MGSFSVSESLKPFCLALIVFLRFLATSVDFRLIRSTRESSNFSGKKNNVMELFIFLDSLAPCSSSGFDFYRKLIPLYQNQFFSTFRISKQNWNFLSLSKVMGLWTYITKIQKFRKFCKTNADVSKFSYNFRVSLCFSVVFNVLFELLCM